MAEDEKTAYKPESVQDVLRRFKLLLIYTVYILLVGVPMWLSTTSIYQSSLPVQEIANLEREVKVNFDIPIFVKVPKPLRYIATETQQLVDAELTSLGVDLAQWHLSLVSSSEQVLQDDEDAYQIAIETATNDQEAFFVNPFGKSVTIYVTELLIANGMVPDFIMRVLLYDVFQEEIRRLNQNGSSQVALPYSDHYHLLFSLVIENGKRLHWEVEEAISEYFYNYAQALSSFTNFTVDTQIQYYCTSSVNFTRDEANYGDIRFLDAQDLQTFVDSGSWNLVDQISLDQTVNFVVYVPESELQIKDSSTNSFIIPQWGGVKLFNMDPSANLITKQELLPILEIFASQLLTLLDFPKTPKSLSIRLDMMKRLTVDKALKDSFQTLNSLIKLVNQLLEIPVPEETSRQVANSLKLIESLQQATGVDEKLLIVNEAAKSANRAFFRKEMIQQNYFPQAHKLTIYLPITGPVFMMLTNSYLRSVFDYLRLKRK